MHTLGTLGTLNIGILAHVDAGKTSLTERLLFDTGAIDRLGSVDEGSTRTDTGELERRRGITIRTAVAPFTVGDLRVNLIDTPGHSDFIAEVERALGVLDAAVLVVSAVEGVQAQTRVLMKSLRRLGLPVLFFVNKTDRTGASAGRTLQDIRARLLRGAVAVPMTGSLADPEFRERVAEVLAEQDDELLAGLVEGRIPGAGELRARIAEGTARGGIHPVYCGSALSGEGVAGLIEGMAAWLPHASGAVDGTPSGTVFAVERAAGTGEKTAYLRLFTGELRSRDRITLSSGDGEHAGRITSLDVVGGGSVLTAGGIARIRGLPRVRVGDRLGPARSAAAERYFAPPALETVVRPVHPREAARLHAALMALADQDPLIAARALPEGEGGGTSVLLYGEVQKEILASTLDEEFGVAAVFEPSRTVHRERPLGTGAAHEAIDRRGGHVFWATVGLRVEPGVPGTGVTFRRETELGALPHALDRAIEETVHRTLAQGLYGWAVTDCTVTLTHSGYASPVSTAADFRNLTPLVLMRALAEAGTRVYEPCHTYELELPADTVGPVTALLGEAGAGITETLPGLLKGTVPARGIPLVERRLPALTRGEAVWWSAPTEDRPCGGRPPTRPRTDGNPLNRAEYLRHLGRA
ncbi:TetM/TetW/TetO/TetS family tetracycline resistance ribosomal protection protein [Streptomyces sp. ET3-23]|uniref:elongation factor G n=1 Tax=Streptomyces sp. ET3-23 TaxID=2885643 RepID=UPI001D1091E1|nr:TetM/TetW/TetO/TetS family tetracycline resistance ribosomal protection protein [Streptomyces sp. ET3-23]MCC2276792.1 TetM/TetW/TetO/TetS family tetracycline resistance ribosomal protection protein [Streptomyces sp. ET3-23]